MINFKNINRADIVLGNVMKVEETAKPIIHHLSYNIQGLGIGVGYIEPGKYSLEEEDAILLRYDDFRFIRLRNFNPYIGPLLLRTVVKKGSPNNGMLLFDSPFCVSAGNNFVDRDSIHPYQLGEGTYNLKKLMNEIRARKSK